MPAGHGNDEEIFAGAVEFGCAPAHACNDELSRDLAIVALLRTAGAAGAPTDEERRRSRAAVLARLAAASDPSDLLPVPAAGCSGPATAVLPPIDEDRSGPATVLLPPIDEDRSAPATVLLPAIAADEPDGEYDDMPGDELAAARRERRAGRHHGRARLGRRIVLTAAAAVVGSAVLGGVLASRDALPGDGLYLIKRATESASLAVTWDDIARAHRHLELASTRIDEVEQLLARDPDTPIDAAVYSAALRDFDFEADEGSRLLLVSSDAPHDQTLADLQRWAAEQADRLVALRRSLPGPAASDAGGSLQRLEQLVGPGTPGAGSCAEVSMACTPAAGDPAGTGPGQAGATGTDPSDPTEAGPASGGAGPSEQSGSQTGTQQSSGDQPGLLPPLLPEPIGGVLSPASPSPTTSTTKPADPRDEGGSDGDEPGGSGGGLPPVEVPAPLPGLPGVSIG